jgi:aspartate/glutamate racemase
MNLIDDLDPIELFNQYLKVTGVAHIDPEPQGEPLLIGKRLGLLNGSSWVTLWSNYFGRLYLPGAHLINVGNEAVQVNFMEAHQADEPTPPQSNIEAFVRYAKDLADLGHVDSILITCSTMNRSYQAVQAAVNVPVVQIDRPMMEEAVREGGRILVVATHGPTVDSTQALLMETAEELGREISFSGLTCEEAWDHLAVGDVVKHNSALSESIQIALVEEDINCIVLAQLSMTVMLLTHPDPIQSFGVPLFTSGKSGMQYMRKLLIEND